MKALTFGVLNRSLFTLVFWSVYP